MEVTLIETCGWASAFHALRLPHKSGDRTDSGVYYNHGYYGGDMMVVTCTSRIGPKDVQLAMRQVKLGDSHAKAMRAIKATFSINAPRYWWQEFITYCIGVLQLDPSNDFESLSSESTVHRLTKDHISSVMFEALPDGINEELLTSIMNGIVDEMSSLRFAQFADNNTRLRAMKAILPECFLQRRAYMLSYQAVRNIIEQRENHPVREWKTFIQAARALPLAEELIFA